MLECDAEGEMKKWEYIIWRATTEMEVCHQANALDNYGREGWELTAVIRELAWNYYYFKRPLKRKRK